MRPCASDSGVGFIARSTQHTAHTHKHTHTHTRVLLIHIACGVSLSGGGLSLCDGLVLLVLLVFGARGAFGRERLERPFLLVPLALLVLPHIHHTQNASSDCDCLHLSLWGAFLLCARIYTLSTHHFAQHTSLSIHQFWAHAPTRTHLHIYTRKRANVRIHTPSPRR